MYAFSRKSVSWMGLVLGTLLMFGCGDSSSWTQGQQPQPSINLNGGNANPATAESYGGDAGGIVIGGSGDLRLTVNGSVDEAFALPAIVNDFGVVKYTVSGSEAVPLNVPASAGGLYLSEGNGRLYIDGGVVGLRSDDLEVTGLEVPKGATLNLPKWSSFELLNDIVIEGTVTSLDPGVMRFGTVIGNLVIGSTGVVTSKSTTLVVAGEIELWAGGVFINQGSIDASGADGSERGNAIFVVGEKGFYNTGLIRADGSSSGTGGGHGGWIRVIASDGTLYSLGTLTANGGSSNSGRGGDGGEVGLSIGGLTVADMKIRGVLQADGGDAVNGRGGDAGVISLENKAPAGSRTLVGAKVSADGGVGDNTGGVGGSFFVWSDAGRVDLVGLEGIALNGGFGANGGGGGGFALQTRSPDGVLPSGAITNEVNIFANGGAGTLGGSGGGFDIRTDAPFDAATFITNSGNLSADGGAGITLGGPGGHMYINSTGAETVNTGVLSVAGGKGETVSPSGTITLDGAPL